MTKSVMSKQQITTIMQQGRIVKRDENGGYTVEYNGKKYYVPKHLALFSVTNPLESQTRKFIDKRDKRIKLNEQLVASDQESLAAVKEEYRKYLESCGVTFSNENCLTGAQKSKVFDFKNGISKLKKSINRAKMSIMGDLLSNFMDYCSIMKMS